MNQTTGRRLWLWVAFAGLFGLVAGVAGGSAGGFILGRMYQDQVPGEGAAIMLPLDVIGTQKPTIPTRCKVLCKLVNDFHGAFENAAGTHDSVRLEQTTPWVTVDGYIAKPSADDAKAVELLQDGKKHMLEVEVQFPDPSADELLITRVIGPAN